MLQHCKACSERTLTPLWADQDGQQWHRCLSCASDSCEATYADVKGMYDERYYQTHHHHEGDPAALRDALRPNVDWFVDWKVAQDVGKDFLDVGCSDGTALTLMQERGFSVHGFDVAEACRQPGCTTIAPFFTADHFPQRYHAVLCREVIEHVDTPHQMLTDLYRVTARGGFLQLQTPRPSPTFHTGPYQRGHLVILSPLVVRFWLERLGFEVKDYRLWPTPDEDPGRQPGQAWMCRKL
jgi:2-polyprenyl-3-methyl-5-hydroxy-6-metoxy-1,4-benzoquinol methylase